MTENAAENAAESTAETPAGRTPGEVDDSVLPEDVRPGEDNPLAEGLDPAETAGDLAPGELLEEGKTPDQWDGDHGDHGHHGDQDGSDGGSDEEQAPTQ